MRDVVICICLAIVLFTLMVCADKKPPASTGDNDQ